MNTNTFSFSELPNDIREQFSSSVRFIVLVTDEIRIQIRLFEKLLEKYPKSLALEHLISIVKMSIVEESKYITVKDILSMANSPSLRTLYRRHDELTKMGLIQKLEISGIPDPSTKTPTLHQILDVTNIDDDVIKSMGKKTAHKEVYNSTLNSALEIQREHGEIVTRQPTGILYREARMMQQFSKVARYDESDPRNRISVIDNYLGDHVHIESVADGDADLWLYEDIEYTTIINGMALNTLEDQLRSLNHKLVTEEQAREKLKK